MRGFTLEDFGSGRPVATSSRSEIAPAPIDRFDDGYNAGWDDAMAQVTRDQGRVAERLAQRLGTIELDQRAANAGALAALEPALRDVFDKLLPGAVERAFLPLLMEEVGRLLADGSGPLTLHVAPEEEPPLVRLLDRAGLSGERIRVRPEPALSISQALIRWEGQERRIDLEAVLAALDDALETFLATMDRGPDAAEPELKEAAND